MDDPSASDPITANTSIPHAPAGIRPGRWFWGLGVVVSAIAIGFGVRAWLTARRAAVDQSTRAEQSHAAGRHADAAKFYAEVLRSQARPLSRAELEQRMARCVTEIDEPAVAVATALTLLDVAPEVSFGKYDYLVARAVGNRTTGMHGVDDTNLLEELLGQSHTAARPEDRPVLERALVRLNVFLEGRGGSPEERQEAESLRQSVQATLAGEPERLTGFMVKQSEEPALPEGSIDELRALAQDAKQPRFQRGKAAFAAGQKLEEQGDKAAALALDREAFELIRSVLPFYKCGEEALHFYQDLRVLDLVADAIARLDPARPLSLKGGLQFHTEGLPLPPGMEIQFAPVLVDAAIEPPAGDVQSDQGFLLYRKIGLRTGQTRWVGVADGKYKLSIGGKGATRESDASGKYPEPLLDVDYRDVPKEIEVRGNTIDLSVRVYRRQELRQLEPADHAPVDLRSAVFRWTPVEGAAFYRVYFSVTDEKQRMMTGIGSFDVPTTSLVLKDQKDEAELLHEYLKPGVTAEWRVAAFDTGQLEIGTLLAKEYHFLVAEPLPRKKADPTAKGSNRP